MRYNIFNEIHKGLRALLYDTALTLQQTDFTICEEKEPALEKVRLTLDYFDKHAEHEDQFVFPAIHQYEPSLADAFEQEHVEDHALAEQLRILITRVETSLTPEEKATTGNALFHAYISFMTFNLDHMGKEEVVLNQRLWRYYTDAEIVAINHRLVASISAHEMGATSAWMMKGLSNTEITHWLKAVQKDAPDVVFTALFGIAEKELPAPRFRKVLEHLSEGAMIA